MMRIRLGIVVLFAVAAAPAAAADPEECATFHEECVVAQNQGERDAGICNVERLECSTSPEPPRRAEPPPARRGDPPRSSDAPDPGDFTPQLR